jgi:hypothetical protein
MNRERAKQILDTALEVSMPWHIAHGAGCPSDAPWAVVKDATSETVGCHPSEEMARRHMAALYANEPNAEILVEHDTQTGEMTMDGRPFFNENHDDIAALAAEYILAAGVADGQLGKPFTVFFVPEGKESRDGRRLALDTTEFDQTPLPIMFQNTASHGDETPDPGVFIGAVHSAYRDPRAPHRMMGRGNLVMNQAAADAETQIRAGLRGVSIDGYGLMPPELEPAVVDQEGNTVALLRTFTDTRIMGATVVPHPAFEDCCIWFDDETEPERVAACMPDQPAPPAEVQLPDHMPALLASSAPLKPPRAWFFTPEPSAIQALEVTPDGHITGHIAAKGMCHTAYKGRCEPYPPSRSDYRFFHVHAAETAEGEKIPCGVLTMETTHMRDPWGTPRETLDHYDHSGLQAAKIRAVNGRYGIWVSGALRPGLEDRDLWMLCGAAVSGDWREVREGQKRWKDELVAVLCVNSPGYPIPRPEVLVASSGEILEQRGSLAGDGRLSFVAPARDSETEPAASPPTILGGTMTNTNTANSSWVETSQPGRSLNEPCPDCERIAELEALVEQLEGENRALRAQIARPTVAAAREERNAALLQRIEAAASGDTSLPLADRGAPWDGPAAEASIWAWAKSGDSFDWGKAAQGFLWHAPNPSKKGDFKLPFARVVGGRLQAVPRGVFACAQRLDATTDVPAADKAGIKSKLNALYKRISTPDNPATPPWQAALEPAPS